MEQILGILSNLEHRCQVALGVWCAERLFPCYEALAEIQKAPIEAEKLFHIIEQLREFVRGKDFTEEELSDLKRRCNTLRFWPDETMPDETYNQELARVRTEQREERDYSQLHNGAIEAVSAVLATLGACSGDALSHIRDAVECLLEPIDGRLWDELTTGLTIVSPATSREIHAKIDAHPKMQAERGRILDQLKRLATTA